MAAGDDTTATHHPDGCERSQLSKPEVAHDAIEVVIVDHDDIEVAIHNDGVSDEERPAAAEPLETKHNKILRFPSNLRRIGREGDYIAPRTVALGPYYHGVPELQAMEVIKHTAVDYFFERLAGKPREETYEEFIPIARAARGFYVDDASAFAGITDDDAFFSMMFVDAIFLVQFLGSLGSDPRLDSMVHPYLVDIMRDILLLENQIPWLVTHFFMALWPLSPEDMIRTLMVSMTRSFLVLEEPLAVDLGESYMPSHLLCLIRSYRAGRCSSSACPRVDPRQLSGRKATTSAAELTQMGIRLRAGKATTAKFSDMDHLVKGRVFADLSLLPLCLDGVTACWLVNMAAFETHAENFMTGGDCSVVSYLTFVSTLMAREDDVRELRARGIVDGFGDKQTLEFFEGLSPCLTPGHAYFRAILAIHEYTQERRLWIAVYRFLYSNSRTIATVLPIVGVLVGIFKTLLSLKQH